MLGRGSRKPWGCRAGWGTGLGLRPQHTWGTRQAAALEREGVAGSVLQLQLGRASRGRWGAQEGEAGRAFLPTSQAPALAPPSAPQVRFHAGPGPAQRTPSPFRAGPGPAPPLPSAAPLPTLISALAADPSETEFAFSPLGSFLLAKQKGSALTHLDLPPREPL